jgi:hypothetical protein
VLITAVEKRFPEGGSRQLYSDLQWMNSSWWGLELGQTYQEKQQAVGMRGTQQLYDMVSGLADPFNDEFMFKCQCIVMVISGKNTGWHQR